MPLPPDQELAEELRKLEVLFAHQLLLSETEKELQEHPRVGASWEGLVIEQVLASEPHDDAWFWGTHQGAEIDLLLRRGDRLYGVECKRADAPARPAAFPGRAGEVVP